MANEDDGAEIQRERERRRTAERQRIQEDREHRRARAARLRGAGPGGAEEPAEPPVDTPALSPHPSDPSGPGRAALGPEEPLAARDIGGRVLGPELRRFLAADATDHFDLQAVNRLPLGGVVLEVGEDPELLGEVAGRAAAMMARVKQEVDDPLNAGAFLRSRTLEWYRSSSLSPAWTKDAGERWAGLFADSRTSGGKLHPWLLHRLRQLRQQAEGAGKVSSRLRRTLLGDRRDPALASRSAHQQIVGEVAQSILDDLAATPRDPAKPTPMVHLSELALRRQTATVNDALALLFSSPETGPFVVLHPNRYPDCEELSIRPPQAGATGAALAYRLVPGATGRRGGARGRGSDPAEGESGAAGEDEAGGSLWEADHVDEAAWTREAESHRRERRHLETPPKDFRNRPAYEPLRTLVLASAEFRKLFLSVKWRGRPAGLPLLATLLQRGKLAPEVATDHEYLDAELDDLVPSDAGPRPDPNVWEVGTWTVRREGSHTEGFRYLAERGTPARDGESA